MGHLPQISHWQYTFLSKATVPCSSLKAFAEGAGCTLVTAPQHVGLKSLLPLQLSDFKSIPNSTKLTLVLHLFLEQMEAEVGRSQEEASLGHTGGFCLQTKTKASYIKSLLDLSWEDLHSFPSDLKLDTLGYKRDEGEPTWKQTSQECWVILGRKHIELVQAWNLSTREAETGR